MGLRHKRGPEQELSSIMALVSYLTNDNHVGRAEQQSSVGERPQLGVSAQRAGARRLGVMVGGTAAAGLPAWSAVIWMMERRPGAIFLLAITAVITVGTAILATAVAMYEARQETKRTEIEYRSADTIAAALSRCVDRTHRAKSD
jgi:hypothetical protein